MDFGKIKLYLFEVLLLVVLFLALFESNIISRSILAVVLLVYAIVVAKAVKYRRIVASNKRQIIFLFTMFAILYLAVFYLSGLYFGFYKSVFNLGFWTLRKFIIPTAIIIVASEVIRFVLLSQKSKVSTFLVIVSMTLIDVIVYTQITSIESLEEFLSVFGFTIFSSISCNLLYDYTSKRYGMWPIIVYRLITSLYSYIIPIIPDVFIFFRSLFRMAYPYFIYLILEHGFSVNRSEVRYVDKRATAIKTVVTVFLMCSIAMLISCKFTYGIIVVGSGSMTGTIDKGDAVVFKQFKNQRIKEGDVIIFNYDNQKVIHRVIDTEVVNNVQRYYTKGDANQQKDDWYITDKDIIGVSEFRIKYVGIPTLWINDVFSK